MIARLSEAYRLIRDVIVKVNIANYDLADIENEIRNSDAELERDHELFECRLRELRDAIARDKESLGEELMVLRGSAMNISTIFWNLADEIETVAISLERGERPPQNTGDYIEPFYRQLLAPLEVMLGPIDEKLVLSIVGFDARGPLEFATIGKKSGEPFVHYVSCELAMRDDQQPNVLGRYELLVSCNDEQWVRTVLSAIGRTSLQQRFEPGDVIDLVGSIDPSDTLQGVLFEAVYSTEVLGEKCGILRCLGVTRDEMAHGRVYGSSSLLARLKEGKVYPHTDVGRKSVVGDG